MNLTTCPCCSEPHGILKATHFEGPTMVKAYLCRECRSTWQAITQDDGRSSLGLIVRSESGRKSAVKPDSRRAQMQKKAKQGAANTRENKMGMSGWSPA